MKMYSGNSMYQTMLDLLHTAFHRPIDNDFYNATSHDFGQNYSIHGHNFHGHNGHHMPAPAISIEDLLPNQNILTYEHIGTDPWHKPDINETASPVPEPATIMLVGLGLMTLGGFGIKKNHKKNMDI